MIGARRRSSIVPAKPHADSSLLDARAVLILLQGVTQGANRQAILARGELSAGRPRDSSPLESRRSRSLLLDEGTERTLPATIATGSSQIAGYLRWWDTACADRRIVA